MTMPSTTKTYRYVKANRKQKRRKLNRMAMRILFDKTSAFYLGIFGLLFSFWLRDQFVLSMPFFQGLEKFLSASFFGIISLALIRPLLASFTRPGVLFSSSDLFLSMLPYDQKKLWQLHVIDRIKKATIIYLIIGLALQIMLPLSGVLIFSFILGFWIVEVLMIIPQWLLYQKSWWLKLLIGQGMSTLIVVTNFVSAWINLTIVLLSLSLIVLIFINITRYNRIHKISDWSNIIETNDRLLRKNILVSFASKVTIEPPKYQGFYHHVIRNKTLRKPFNPQRENQMYHRIIFIKMIEQKEYLIKLAAVLFVLLTLMSILSAITYSWAIVIVIYLYSHLGSRLFLIIFEDRLIFSLPWKIKRWRKLFTRWLLIGFIPLILLLFLPSLYWFDLSWLTLLNWISYFAIGYTLLQDQMVVRATDIVEEGAGYPVFYLVTFIIFIFGVIYSFQLPIVSVLILIYAVVRYTSQYTRDKE